MSKTIKFNLICDGNPVRTLEDLRNNFSIEDVLTYYGNKLLHRWLLVRGFTEQLGKVESIEAKDQLEIVNKLIEIFEVEADAAKIKEHTYVLEYNMEKEVLLEEYKNMDYKTKSILDDYHNGYRILIGTILEHKDDMPRIKAALREMITNYSELVELDYRNLFYNFVLNAPKAVFAMLMTELFRPYYLPFEDLKTANGESDSDQEEMYREVCLSISSENTLIEVLGEDLKSFSGNTEAYWKDVEAKGKKFMILKMENGNFIRSAGVNGGDLPNSEIQNKFMILDGIDYKSNNAFHKLLYLEV